MHGLVADVSADGDSEVETTGPARSHRVRDRPLPLPFPNAGCWVTSWFSAANPTEGKVSRPLSFGSPGDSSPVRPKVSAKRNR